MSMRSSHPLRFLRIYLAPQRGRVLLLFALMALDLALVLLLPDLARRLIDGALAGELLPSLLTAAGAYLAATIAGDGIDVARRYVAQDIGLRSTNRLRADLARHCLRLDMSFHNARTPGEMIERVDGDVGKLTLLLSHLIVDLARSALLVVGALILLISIDWRIALPAIITIVLCAIALRLLGPAQVRANADEREVSGELFGFVEERLSGSEDIRANGATRYVLGQHIKRSRSLLRTMLKAALYGSASWLTTLLAIELSGVLATAIAALRYLDGALSLGQVYAVFAYMNALREPIQDLMRQFTHLPPAVASVGRIQALFDMRTSITYPSPGTGDVPPSGALSVSANCVSFAYPGDDTVLDNISFALSPGQTLGVIGRTGSGKTTLTRLLLRLYDPAGGDIQLGGVKLSRVEESSLRQRVAIVTQDVQLFSASVRDNVTLFDPHISDAQTLEALSLVGLDGWLQTQPNGIDTMLAVGGSGLSAGEAQLLAFARAFLRDPGLVILDEASSRLDPATEARLASAVDALLRGRSGIIIAHRLQTLDRVDQILLLDGGRIVEYGPRAALATSPTSQFAQLLRLGIEETLV